MERIYRKQNEERAALAQKLYDLYLEMVIEEDCEDALVDMLADVFHLIRQKGYEYDEVEHRAEDHFQAEVEEEEKEDIQDLKERDTIDKGDLILADLTDRHFHKFAKEGWNVFTMQQGPGKGKLKVMRIDDPDRFTEDYNLDFEIPLLESDEKAWLLAGQYLKIDKNGFVI